MPAVSVRRMDEPSDTSDARGLQARASASFPHTQEAPPRRCARVLGKRAVELRPRSSAFSMRVQQRVPFLPAHQHGGGVRQGGTSASAIGSPTSGHARWPDCMAALFAMARHRCVCRGLPHRASRWSARTTSERTPKRQLGGVADHRLILSPYCALHEHHEGRSRRRGAARCAPPDRRRKRRSRTEVVPGGVHHRDMLAQRKPQHRGRASRRPATNAAESRPLVGKHLVVQVQKCCRDGDPLVERGRRGALLKRGALVGHVVPPSSSASFSSSRAASSSPSWAPRRSRARTCRRAIAAELRHAEALHANHLPVLAAFGNARTCTFSSRRCRRSRSRRRGWPARWKRSRAHGGCRRALEELVRLDAARDDEVARAPRMPPAETGYVAAGVECPRALMVIAGGRARVPAPHSGHGFSMVWPVPPQVLHVVAVCMSPRKVC